LKANDCLLCPKEAANLLGVSVKTLSNWRTKKRKGPKIPYIKLGKLIKYRLSVVNEFLNELTKDTKE
jgi:DNA-binding transcriptional regulator YiaG